MPYIITTTLRTDDVVADALESVGTRVLFSGVPRATRTAVATLEEARAAVWAQVFDSRSRTIDGSEVDSLPGSGGTIGPLPDGAVIEVRRVMHAELAREAGLGRRDTPMMSDAAIVAAFNAS
jgi:hypothetical protein